MKRWALCMLGFTLAVGLLSCSTSTTSGGSGGGGSNGSNPNSRINPNANPSSFSAGGGTTTLTWSTNTVNISGTLILTYTTGACTTTATINDGVALSPVISGTANATIGATTIFCFRLFQNGTEIDSNALTVTVSGSGGGGGGGGSGSVTATPTVFYADGPLTSLILRIQGTGFTAADSFILSPQTRWATGVTRQFVNSTEWDYFISLDNEHFSPGWLYFTFCPASGTTCATAVPLAFIGNQNTAVVNPSGNLFQLDQAQGLTDPRSNGYVYEFQPSGAGSSAILHANGAGLMGAFYNSIAVDNWYSAWDPLFNLDGAIWSIVAGLPLPHGQISGGVSNLLASSVLDHYACSVFQIVVSNTGSVVCTSDITAGSLIKTAVGPSSLAPWGVAMVRTYNPSATDPTKVASNNYYAVVYARGDAAVRRYDIATALDGSIATITQPKGVILPGFTAQGSNQGVWTEGWWIVAFNPAYTYPTASPLLGKVAVLSRVDRKLAVVDVNNLSQANLFELDLGTADLKALGDPMRLAADPANGKLIVAFADLSGTTPITRFISVDPTVTPLTYTKLASTSTLLASGLAVSIDGSTLFVCMQSTCLAYNNN